MNLYKLREEREMKPSTFANVVAHTLYEKRFGPCVDISVSTVVFAHVILLLAGTSSSLLSLASRTAKFICAQPILSGQRTNLQTLS